MCRVYIDFETRSTFDLKKVGSWVYSRGPTTSVLCLAYAIGDGPVQLLPRPFFTEYRGDIPQGLLEAIKNPEVLFVAHNSGFEQDIWENILYHRYGWPLIGIKRWRCTMAKALSLALPASLEKCSMALGLEIQKDIEGSRLLPIISKPRRPSKHNPDIWFQDRDRLERLYEYCKTDVVVERLIDQELPDLPHFEQQVWFMDQEMNRRGLRVDMELVEAAISIFEKYNIEQTSLLSHITEGEVEKPTHITAMKKWIQKQGIEIDSLDKEHVDKLLKTDLPEVIKKVLLIRKGTSNSSVKKYHALKRTTDSDGRTRRYLAYHFATTGRWAGRGFQPQNLPSGSLDHIGAVREFIKKDADAFQEFFPNIPDSLSSVCRSALIPAKGHRFMCADYSSIEVRVLFWLAGDEKGLELLRKGEDLYLDIAKDVFNRTNLTKKDSYERNIGKMIILGCGFGMGPKTFSSQCRSRGLEIDLELAKKAVETYRTTYYKVKKLWYALEDAATECVLMGKAIKVGKVKYGIRGNFLLCQLPSGRDIAYYKPEIRKTITPWGSEKDLLSYMGIDSRTKQYQRLSSYGGHLAQNITQSSARDFMVFGMLNAQRNGYPVVLTVHDEVLSEVPEKHGSIIEYCDLLCQIPEWGKGCPLSIDKEEAWEGYWYRKE